MMPFASVKTIWFWIKRYVLFVFTGFILALTASNFALGANASNSHSNKTKACEVPWTIAATAPDTTEGPIKVSISVYLIDRREK